MGISGNVNAFILTLIFPILSEKFGGWAFLVISGVSGVSLVYLWWRLVEPRGKSYEEIRKIIEKRRWYF